MRRFADEGFARATVRAIAADAGVSPALVMHHFGSKEGLRAACDDRVRAIFVQAQTATREGGPAGGMSAVMSLSEEALAMASYLARLSAEGIPGATTLFAQLIATTAESMDQLVAAGVARPSADPQMRAAVLFCLRAGAILLADAVAEATGSDVREAPGLTRLARATLEIMVGGVLTDPALLDAFDAAAPGPRAGGPTVAPPDDPRSDPPS